MSDGVIRIVTDSTSDIEPEAAASAHVDVVPLTVRFGADELRDRVELTSDDFYRRLRGSSVNPTTSQPPPAAFADVFRRRLDEGASGIVSLHLPSTLSGTLQSATVAATEVDAARIRAVDCGTVSIGLQFLIKGALDDIGSGCDLDTVVRNVEERRSRVGILVLMDTLVYLQRGGRIGRAQAFVGGVLKVKPVLSVRNGEVIPVTRVRSRRQGFDTLVTLLAAEGPLEAVGVVSTDAPDDVAPLRDRIESTYSDLTVLNGRVGPVVGTYAGPGALGVGFLRKE